MNCSFEVGSFLGYPVITVHGELDAATCPDFAERLRSASQHDSACVIVDLLDVPYSEAAPLRGIIEVSEHLRRDDKILAVVCCAPFVDRLLDLAGVSEHLSVFPGLEEAIAHLGAECHDAQPVPVGQAHQAGTAR